jgi:UDP-N-acetylmuramoyl-tripeptide--D-alanyl-D-alanine ligase
MKLGTLVRLARDLGYAWESLPTGDAEVRVVIDSRQAVAGTLFAPLPGTRVDGHQFLVAGAEAGCRLMLAERAKVDGETLAALTAAGVAVLWVPDVLGAMQALAAAYRATFACPVLGLTGTSGKTTTKELLRHVLAGRFRVASTHGNHNNHIGLPLSILNAAEDAQVGVFEVGISRPGEMRELAAILRPDHALVVSVGAAHLEELGSVDTVAAEKLELPAAVPAPGRVWVPADHAEVEKHLAKVRATVARVGTGADAAVRVIVHDAGRATLQLGAERADLVLADVGAHVLVDAAFAVAAAVHLGVPLAEAAARVASFVGVAQRGNWVDVRGVRLLDDSYNANVLSMKASLALVADKARAEGRRLVVLAGEMREMGAAAEAVHREVGRAIGASGAALVALVGGQNAAYRAGLVEQGATAEVVAFDDAASAAAWAKQALRAGDLALLKGSRGVRMEVIRMALEEAV